jgi:UDP-N-acetylmuramate dehydrogenase
LLKNNYPLKELNTWGVGGSCASYILPASLREVREAVLAAGEKNGPLYILGGGSNVLISDEPLNVTVLHTKDLNGISFIGKPSDDMVQIEVEPGYPVKKLLAHAISMQLGGLEFLAGIPGTVGGALWGNAGACGEGFAPLVEFIETVDRHGDIKILPRESIEWHYRACPCDPENAVIITKCRLKLSRVKKEDIFRRIRYFAEAKKGQPLGRKTAGCVFKNPQGTASAGKLLDDACCKGLRIGGAVVSQFHANFVENDGSATSQDIYGLCEICRERVLSQYGVNLEYEIKFLGSFSLV